LYLLLLIPRSEIWTLREKERKRLTSIETKCFSKIAGYKLFDYKMNEEILEELKVEPADDKLRRYKSNWLRHVKKHKNEQQDAKNNAEDRMDEDD